MIDEDGSGIKLIIRRMKCQGCGRLHHELPDCIVPYKRCCTELIALTVSDNDVDADTFPGEISTLVRLRVWFKLLREYVSVTYTLKSKMVNTCGDMDYIYIIYDWLENTMKADMDSFAVYVLDDSKNKKALAKGIDYTLENIEGQNESQEVFVITFLFDENSSFYNDAYMGHTILVNYTAEMTETATSGTLSGRENYNKVWIEYGTLSDTDKTVEKEWDVYTIALNIHKTDESGNALKGAEFAVYSKTDSSMSSPLKFSKHADDYYYYDS